MLVNLQKEEDFFSFLLSNQNKTILVKFFTTWCGPCQELQGTLLQVLNERNDLIVLEVNAEKFPYLAQRKEFNVSSVPTLFLFKEGKVVAKKSGNMNIQQLKEFISIS